MPYQKWKRRENHDSLILASLNMDSNWLEFASACHRPVGVVVSEWNIYLGVSITWWGLPQDEFYQVKQHTALGPRCASDGLTRKHIHKLHIVSLSNVTNIVIGIILVEGYHDNFKLCAPLKFFFFIVCLWGYDGEILLKIKKFKSKNKNQRKILYKWFEFWGKENNGPWEESTLGKAKSIGYTY